LPLAYRGAQTHAFVSSPSIVWFPLSGVPSCLFPFFSNRTAGVIPYFTGAITPLLILGDIGGLYLFQRTTQTMPLLFHTAEGRFCPVFLLFSPSTGVFSCWTVPVPRNPDTWKFGPENNGSPHWTLCRLWSSASSVGPFSLPMLPINLLTSILSPNCAVFSPNFSEVGFSCLPFPQRPQKRSSVPPPPQPPLSVFEKRFLQIPYLPPQFLQETSAIPKPCFSVHLFFLPVLTALWC